MSSPANPTTKSAAQRSASKSKAIRQGVDATTRAIIDGLKDKEPSVDDISSQLTQFLPPEVQKAINEAKKLQAMLEKVYPKGKDGERDFSTAGGLRTALDLLAQYGGRDIQKVLAARQKALDLAAKLGINVPSIEDLVDMDWSTLGDKLSNLSLSDVVSVNSILNSLEGELMKFLPPGMEQSLGHLKTMMKEFGLPTSLSEAYDTLTKKAEEPKAPPKPSASAPGVFVNKHHIARKTLTFMAHGALPLGTEPGTGGAKTVFVEKQPVWRATPMDLHLCKIIMMVPPSIDGPGFPTQGSQDVKAEGFSVCRHDLDGIDSPICTKTNLFLTQAQAMSAWNHLQSLRKSTDAQDQKGKGKGSGSGDGGTNKDKQTKPEDQENGDGDGNNKDREKSVVSAPFITKCLFLQDKIFVRATCKSYDPDTGGSASNPNSSAIVRRDWVATCVLGEVSVPNGAIDQEFQFVTKEKIDYEYTVTVKLTVADDSSEDTAWTTTSPETNELIPVAKMSRKTFTRGNTLITLSVPARGSDILVMNESFLPGKSAMESIDQYEWRVKIDGSQFGISSWEQQFETKDLSFVAPHPGWCTVELSVWSGSRKSVNSCFQAFQINEALTLDNAISVVRDRIATEIIQPTVVSCSKTTLEKAVSKRAHEMIREHLLTNPKLTKIAVNAIKGSLKGVFVDSLFKWIQDCLYQPAWAIVRSGLLDGGMSPADADAQISTWKTEVDILSLVSKLQLANSWFSKRLLAAVGLDLIIEYAVEQAVKAAGKEAWDSMFD